MVSGRVIARPARATSARSRPPGSGDNLAQLVRSRNCSRPREHPGTVHDLGNRVPGRPWLATTQSGNGVADASACTALSAEDRDQAGQCRAAGRRRPVKAQAGHTREAQVTVAPVQHPSPWWPRVWRSQRGQEPRPLAASALAPGAAGARPPSAATGRGRTPPRPGLPGMTHVVTVSI
jgi:hypothetical protein